MRTTVRDVMTTRVVAVRINATFKDIATLLTEYRVSAFPNYAILKMTRLHKLDSKRI